MAKKTASAIQALTISLIIFVMLTFVLAVTTYVFFAQKQDAVVASKTANEAASAAQQDKQKAEQAQQSMLRDVIGADEGQTVEDIKAELTGMRDKVKGGADENTTPEYRSLVKTLVAAIQKANDDNKSLAEAVETQKKLREAAEEDRDTDREAYKASSAKKADELKAVADKAPPIVEEGKEAGEAAQALAIAETIGTGLVGLRERAHAFVTLARGRVANGEWRQVRETLDRALEAVIELDIPDIVLTDLHMPEMNGLEFYKAAEKDNLIQDIAFLIVSAENEKEKVILALKAGIKDYLVKPIDVDLLEQKIEKLLG